MVTTGTSDSRSVITQRLSTIRYADQIAFLGDSQVVRADKHNEPVASEGGICRQLERAGSAGQSAAAQGEIR